MIAIELVIAVAAAAIAWLVFTWSIEVLKVSIKTALAVAAILLVLQIVFGIQSEQIWQTIGEMIYRIEQLISNYITLR